MVTLDPSHETLLALEYHKHIYMCLGHSEFGLGSRLTWWEGLIGLGQGQGQARLGCHDYRPVNGQHSVPMTYERSNLLVRVVRSCLLLWKPESPWP